MEVLEMSNESSSRIHTEVNLGGGVVGHKSVTTNNDGTQHVTHALNTNLRFSYDVGANGTVSDEHYVAKYSKGKKGNQVVKPKSSFMDIMS